jgi:hypothetical protein
MLVVTVKFMWLAISAPWSQVMDRHSSLGRVVRRQNLARAWIGDAESMLELFESKRGAESLVVSPALVADELGKHRPQVLLVEHDPVVMTAHARDRTSESAPRCH